MAFSPDGKTLALAASDPPVRLWDVGAGKLVQTLDAHGVSGQDSNFAFAMAVAFSPDGKRLASAGREAIMISDVATGKTLARYKREKAWINSLAFTPDGKTLVAGDENAKAHVWDAVTGQERFTLDRRMWIGRSAALSSDGKTVAVGGVFNAVRLWDVTSGKELFPDPDGHDAPVHAVAFSPDGRLLVSGGANGHIHFWDAADGRHLRRLKGNSASAVSFAPDGRRLATAWTFNKTVRVWDVDTGDEVLKLPHDTDDRGIGGVAFAAGGKTLVTADWKPASRLYVWDAATGKPLRELSLGEQWVSFLALAPGSRVAAAGDAAVMHVCDLERGKELLSWHEGKRRILSVACSPDGQVLATGGRFDGTVCLREMFTGEVIATLKRHERAVSAIVFSPDGRVGASAEGADSDQLRGKGPLRIRFWDVATGAELATLQGHDATVSCLAFSLDGKRLASGLGNGTVLLWDVPARAKAPPLPARALTAKEVEAAWADLAGADAAKAHAAVWALAAAPGQAVTFLRRRLPPAEAVDPKKLSQWLADLDANDFDVRDRAAGELYRLGARAEPELRKALAAKPSAEVKRHIAAILTAMEGPPPSEVLRALRAVRALQAAGTPEARQLLAVLANGQPDARLTQEAKAAVERLGRMTR